MASIRCRRETGTLFYDFRYRGIRCREQTDLSDTPVNRRSMEKTLKRIEAAIRDGSFDYAAYFPESSRARRFATQVVATPPATAAVSLITSSEFPGGYPSPTLRNLSSFGEFARIHFREQGVGWRINTREWMESLLETHLLPAFGDRPLHSIRREDLLAFRADLAERTKHGRRLSPKTVNVVMRILKAILTEASARYGIPNPAVNIRRLKVPRHDVQPFTLEEVQLILARVRADYRPYLTAAFFTGMRPGELNGLKWEHIDFDSGLILVRETFTKGRTEYTKTDGSQREIQISPPVLQALKQQDRVSRPISDYVFCARGGSPVHAKNFADRVWHPLLRHLGLRRRVPYQTRHTAATLWLAAGESPEWIARQLGHTTTEMLFRVYSRYVPNLTRRDGSAFEALLSQRGLIEDAHQDRNVELPKQRRRKAPP